MCLVGGFRACRVLQIAVPYLQYPRSLTCADLYPCPASTHAWIRSQATTGLSYSCGKGSPGWGVESQQIYACVPGGPSGELSDA